MESLDKANIEAQKELKTDNNYIDNHIKEEKAEDKGEKPLHKEH